MTKISDLHRRWSKDAAYTDVYDALGEEMDVARALIGARTAAGLSQSQLARRMKTSQSDRCPQAATRTRLRIVFEPNATR